jgi:hypothetical protein
MLSYHILICFPFPRGPGELEERMEEKHEEDAIFESKKMGEGGIIETSQAGSREIFLI